jgi:hypothetical protein
MERQAEPSKLGEENMKETWRNLKVAQTSRTMRGKTIIELTL